MAMFSFLWYQCQNMCTFQRNLVVLENLAGDLAEPREGPYTEEENLVRFTVLFTKIEDVLSVDGKNLLHNEISKRSTK